MNYVIGSAIKIKSEPSIVIDTTMTLDLYDPDGDKLLDDEAMVFDTVNTSIAFKVWQSIVGTHTLGRYKYIVKATNGTFSNQAKGFFNLEEE